MTHVAIAGTENHNSLLDGNDIETLTEPKENNQSRGGPTTNKTIDCITEDEAFNRNFTVYNFPAHNSVRQNLIPFHSYIPTLTKP